jgi:hypothetical protein
VSPFLRRVVKESKGTDKFQARTVNLADGLEDKNFEANKPAALCSPLSLSAPTLTIQALDPTST